jgi:hypothetical protein
MLCPSLYNDARDLPLLIATLRSKIMIEVILYNLRELVCMLIRPLTGMSPANSTAKSAQSGTLKQSNAIRAEAYLAVGYG